LTVERIRGRPLQRIRKRILSVEPLCVACKEQGRVTVATEVDHILALHKGGADDDTNRQPLCGPCHKAKTAQDVNPRPVIGDDGWPLDG
jgi:5-methylcytosine-specific restriction protein A